MNSNAADIKIIKGKQSIFEDNDKDAALLREELRQSGTYFINLMSSPGSGKTTALLALHGILKDKVKMGIMEADIDSCVDAAACNAAGIKTVQIHTGGMCHLDADMARQGLRQLGTDELDLVILENVGNLVCPAEFDTGAFTNITLLSVPEGHDKPLKYPLMYQVCDLLVVTKTDVMEYFDFDPDKLTEYAKNANPDIDILFVSAKTGEGMDAFADWILKKAMA